MFIKKKNIILLVFLVIATLQIQAQKPIGKAKNVTLEIGQSYTFSAPMNRQARVKYQWVKNNKPIKNARSANFTIQSVKTSDRGIYFCSITSSKTNKQIKTAPTKLEVVNNVKTTGSSKTITREPGKKYTFYAYVYDTNFRYQWYKNGDPINGAKSSTYTIPALKKNDAGVYHCRISKPGQNTADQSAPLKLEVGQCGDNEGGRYPCDELMVKFIPDLGQGQQDKIREASGSTLIDKCRCREFQLWQLPDSLGVEEKGVAATKDPEVNDAGANYFTKKLKFALDNFNYRPDLTRPLDENPAKIDALVVALIDTGVDYWHPDLRRNIWINPLESKVLNGVDEDANCYIDDVQGFNFLTDKWENMDDNGHGTHIAGIIAQNSPSAKIMNLKAFDKDGGGNLFNPICAIYYAADHKAKVLNLSWGYYGAPSSPLERAIAYAGKQGGTVIASAGNDTTSHAANKHYPSGFDLDNLITVAALNAAENDLADFSNFGSRKIDLAARGENIRSSLLGGGEMRKRGLGDGTIRMSGSSMSTGFVSSATFNLKEDQSSSTIRGIKHSLFTTVDPVSDRLTTGGKLNEPNALSHLRTSSKATAREPELDLKVFLQGPYDPASGLMNDGIRSLPDFPSTQPFNQAPWFYTGTESVSASTLAVSGNEAVVDWVLIAYQDTPTAHVTTRAALLRRNGSITAVNGNPIKLGRQFRACNLLVMARGHLAFRTRYTRPLDYLPTTVDLTQGNIRGLKKDTGKNFLIAGDVNQDGRVNNADISAGFSRAADPYTPSDVNKDGNVDATDGNITNSNRTKQSNCRRCYSRF